MPGDFLHNDENILFLKLAHGDEQAYTDIFHLFTPRLFPYILKITRNEHLAKELLQETFLKLWTNRADLERVEYPASWLFRIAANCCLMHLRKQANRYRLQQDAMNAVEATHEGTMNSIEARDLKRIIHKAVDALPPKRQEIYRLSREEGLSHQQIAGRLSISLQTVKNQIGLALKFIQEVLHRETGLLVLMYILL